MTLIVKGVVISLPKFQSDDPSVQKMQTTWAQAIDPVIALPLNSGLLLTDIALTTGSNVINHKLGRALIGWFLTRNNAAVTVYDTQSSNSTPALTLALTASGAAKVSIYVF